MFRSKFHYLVNPCRNTQGSPSVKVIICAQQTKDGNFRSQTAVRLSGAGRSSIL